MSGIPIDLLPLGRRLEVAPGTPLQDVLFDQGAEFPCGGKGRCKGCRIRVLEGVWPPGADEERLLSRAELREGWRLACRGRAQQPLKLDLAQWEAPILADDSRFQFSPREGLGVAVDLGTTTVVAQLLDLHTGQVLAVQSGWNDQAKHGADIMSRVEFATHDRGQATLQTLVRSQIGRLIHQLLGAQPVSHPPLCDIVLVGNTVMHHLFCGLSVEPFSHYPFEPRELGLVQMTGQELGWSEVDQARVHFLPCLGGFVGSDLLAGILATRLHESAQLTALIDLGTNGEIVVGNRDRILCASTAAGPAFEGARIEMGMRAATGAISSVSRHDLGLQCHVLGDGPPRGICGSGLVDAAAAALDLGWIEPSGRLTQGSFLPLADPVRLAQQDIRELQLAKGAIAAGLRLLLQQWGARVEDLNAAYLAGAFGNYINRASARRIGLLPIPLEIVRPAGNTALLGAKTALFTLPHEDGEYRALRHKTHHVSLHEDPLFQEVFMEEMAFPHPAAT